MAWVSAQKSCESGSISLQFLTDQTNSVVLFWGQTKLSTISAKAKKPPRRIIGKRSVKIEFLNREKRQLLSKNPNRGGRRPDMLVVEIVEGLPVATFHIMGAEYILKLKTRDDASNYRVDDFEWHRIDLKWKGQVSNVVSRSVVESFLNKQISLNFFFIS